MSETIGTVALMSPGDMGHAIGRTLRAGGRISAGMISTVQMPFPIRADTWPKI